MITIGPPYRTSLIISTMRPGCGLHSATSAATVRGSRPPATVKTIGWLSTENSATLELRSRSGPHCHSRYAVDLPALPRFTRVEARRRTAQQDRPL